MMGKMTVSRLSQHQKLARRERLCHNGGNVCTQFVGFKPAAYDKTTQKMSFIDPSRKEDFVSISGTKMRKYARGEMPDPDPPAGFMAPSAWKIVKDYYSSLKG
eukprot:SAG31_NODE_103_length_25164_cov_12.124317_8_plen_103_part_00